MADELKSYSPTLTERTKWSIQDLLMSLGMNTRNSQHISGGVTDLLGFTPMAIPMGVSEMSHGMDSGSPGQVALGALGAIPGAGTLKAGKGFKKAADLASKSIKDNSAEIMAALAKALGKPQISIPKSTKPASAEKLPKVDFAEDPLAGLSDKAKQYYANTSPASINGKLFAETGLAPKPDKFGNYPTAHTIHHESYSDGGQTIGQYVVKDPQGQFMSVHPSKGEATDWAKSYDKSAGFNTQDPVDAVMEKLAKELGADIPGAKPSASNNYFKQEPFNPDNIYPPPVYAEPKKPAPVDSGADMMTWLDKNPGASINDFLGIPNKSSALPAKMGKLDQSDLMATSGPSEKYKWDWQNNPDAAGQLWVPPTDILRAQKDIDPLLNKFDPTQLAKNNMAQPEWLDAIMAHYDRLKGGYTEKAFHGTRGIEYQSKDKTKLPINADEFYSTKNPILAEQYASGLTRNPSDGYKAVEGAQIMPLWINASDYHKVDGAGRQWTEVNRNAITEARHKDMPGVRIDNVWDEFDTTQRLPEPNTIFITLPEGHNTVRSSVAKFDPKKFNINDLLAGLAGAGVVGSAAGGMSDGQ